jgi:hypothetical protein
MQQLAVVLQLLILSSYTFEVIFVLIRYQLIDSSRFEQSVVFECLCLYSRRSLSNHFPLKRLMCSAVHPYIPARLLILASTRNFQSSAWPPSRPLLTPHLPFNPICLLTNTTTTNSTCTTSRFRVQWQARKTNTELPTRPPQIRSIWTYNTDLVSLPPRHGR